MNTGLPDPQTAREWLATMTLIRRFEERAGEMYARAKVGGFLHLSIGEEATIVGGARALRASDYLISTYRSHGHALVRGTPPGNVMAELFGRVDGCSGGRGGSMHMFDLERRFMGGYGIVGGNLPIAAGIALASDYRGEDDVTLCTFGDGASNQGTFGETLNLAALWRLPVVFMVTNNQFGMGTALGRHSAVTDLQRKGESLGVPGMRCDGMDVLDTHAVISEALRRVREERRPVLVEADHLPLPRPFDGRPRGVPLEGGGRPLARARPDPRLRRSAGARGDPRRRRARADRRTGTRAGGRGCRFRGGIPLPAARVAVRRRVRARQPGARLVLRAHLPTRVRRRRCFAAGKRPHGGEHGGDSAADHERPASGRGRLMAELRYREALNAALREELARDERVILMGEDIGVFGGAFKVTAGLLDEFGERRVRDTPISENTIVGMGVGAAMVGLRPVVELMTINFALLALRSDRQPRRPHPLHVRRAGPRTAGRAHAPGRGPPAWAPPTRTAWRRSSCTCPGCSSPPPPPPPTPRAC